MKTYEITKKAFFLVHLKTLVKRATIIMFVLISWPEGYAGPGRTDVESWAGVGPMRLLGVGCPALVLWYFPIWLTSCRTLPKVCSESKWRQAVSCTSMWEWSFWGPVTFSYIVGLFVGRFEFWLDRSDPQDIAHLPDIISSPNGDGHRFGERRR